ncbi:MAG: elongation factor P [Dehalococcoidia bacterium]|nr:elongation factor P [Dehalococcoidia bacterium]
MSIEISEVNRNTKLLIDGVPYAVEDVNFVKPGKGRAIYRIKMRNLFDGVSKEVTYHSGDRVEEVSIVSHDMQYLYEEGDHYVFMDTESYEQHPVSKSLLGTKAQFLKEGTIVSGIMMGTRIIGIDLPKFVELAVVESAVSTKTDTVTAQMKPVKLETGATVSVPTFVKEGDILKIDTRTGTYVERVTKK